MGFDIQGEFDSLEKRIVLLTHYTDQFFPKIRRFFSFPSLSSWKVRTLSSNVRTHGSFYF